jgi:hypothetical protein
MVFPLKKMIKHKHSHTMFMFVFFLSIFLSPHNLRKKSSKYHIMSYLLCVPQTPSQVQVRFAYPKAASKKHYELGNSMDINT